MRSEDFSSEFDYPYKIVTENEGSVDVLSISRALLRAEIFYLWTSPSSSVHKAKILSLSLEFCSKALVRGY